MEPIRLKMITRGASGKLRKRLTFERELVLVS